ncbi:MAG: hypothetical protein H5T59_05765 [Anaerolineae bacterium]|nr:hypothetical protein [Anaerolineae bacterium]
MELVNDHGLVHVVRVQGQMLPGEDVHAGVELLAPGHLQAMLELLQAPVAGEPHGGLQVRIQQDALRRARQHHCPPQRAGKSQVLAEGRFRDF